MGFIDDIKVDQELQVKTLCVAFFLVIFPLYFFSVAAGTDSPTRMGGVGSYEVSGEISYIDFDEGGEYIADGTSLTIDLNTDSLSDMEQEMNIVGVLVSMTYGEDETNSGGPACAGPQGGQNAADTIVGAASHLNFSESTDGQNGGGNTGHEASTIWYNSSMIDQTVEGLSESSITEQLDSKGAGLGDYTVDISVSAAAGNAPGPFCSRTDTGEDVSYTIQLIVLDYTITPFIDVDDIDV